MFDIEKRWLARIFDAILPRTDALPGARDLPLHGLVDDLTRSAPPLLRWGVRAASFIVTWFGPCLTGRLRSFGSLERAERVAVLITLSESSHYLVRELPVLLKMVACLAYAGLPDVQRAVGIGRVDETPPAWATEVSWAR